jgi:hypothetical protein
MISSLEDARHWYEGVRALANDMDRIGSRYWNEEPYASKLALDGRFRFVESSVIAERTRTVLDDLDDLAVLLMFSVFEAIVRDQALIDVDGSLAPPLHPAVGRAVDDLKQDLRSGSFARVTAAFQSLDTDLVEQVNQVRRYRNWVAHGRRGNQPPLVDPARAFDRLSRFLEKMTEAAQATKPLTDDPPF